MIDLLPYIIFIDSCAFHPPQQDEKKAIDKLFELDERGRLCLEIGKATEEEMKRAPTKLRDRVNSRMTSMDTPVTQQEKIKWVEIKELLFPNKKTLNENEEEDVSNIFCAQNWGCSMFVTVDKGHLLSKADLIKQKLGMDVVFPTQCLKVVLDRMKGIKNITVREFE